MTTTAQQIAELAQRTNEAPRAHDPRDITLIEFTANARPVRDGLVADFIALGGTFHQVKGVTHTALGGVEVRTPTHGRNAWHFVSDWASNCDRIAA